MAEQNQKLSIIAKAKNQRHVYLLEKIQSKKPLTQKEISELARYEKAKQPEIQVQTDARKKRKPGGGRKSKYNPDMVKAVKALTKQGLTDEQLAEFFGVHKDTIQNWKKQFPLFFDSLKTGKAIADTKVEAALYQRAIGYSTPDVHISCYEGAITVTPIIKHYPPDTTAQIFWLKNRKPKQWRDKQDIEHSGEINGNKIIPIMPGMSKEQWLQSLNQNQKSVKKSDKKM
jgi:transcriptional regulator with XRE-family HTH domain